ncbi:MAG: dihydrolipoamide acetyltransferase family protein [Gammaproteobacteria bacterium]|nr:dihydrolipoamide acetyltransferase family protein [Gammaproteobacteria bacterium]
MKRFKLPDLGEGLREAEIVEWHVKEGDEVAADQSLVSMETDKAIVEVPSPRPGTIARRHGEPGDIVQVGSVLVEFTEGADEPPGKADRKPAAADKGTVVGAVESGDEVIEEQPSTIGHARLGVKAMPAVRALAKRLSVDLGVVTPSGPDGLIIASDVQRVAKIFAELGPLELLRGPRRVMARNMTLAREEVVPVTICDDADIDEWPKGADVTMRLIRAIVAGVRAEPALNAWYDTHAIGRRVLEKIHLGMAVDTEEGLFVPVLHDVGNRGEDDLRKGLERLKADVRARKIPPEEMRGYTFTLSNFGTIFGRYANPIVQPPTVAILGAGAIRDEVRARQGKPAVRRTMPISLTFDHRAVTGGEAARFLAAVAADLQQAS